MSQNDRCFEQTISPRVSCKNFCLCIEWVWKSNCSRTRVSRV